MEFGSGKIVLVVLLIRVGAKEPGGKGQTEFVKYVAATAALSNNVYKHALKTCLVSLSVFLNQRPWVYGGVPYLQTPQTLTLFPNATRDLASRSLKWTGLAGIRGN